jgi:hypothetical protein
MVKSGTGRTTGSDAAKLDDVRRIAARMMVATPAKVTR